MKLRRFLKLEDKNKSFYDEVEQESFTARAMLEFNQEKHTSAPDEKFLDLQITTIKLRSLSGDEWEITIDKLNKGRGE